MTNTMDGMRWSSRAAERWARPVLAFVVVLGLALLAALPSQAQKFTVLYDFKGGTDGRNPLAGLVVDASGNLYGTTELGGIPDYLCLYRPRLWHRVQGGHERQRDRTPPFRGDAGRRNTHDRLDGG